MADPAVLFERVSFAYPARGGLWQRRRPAGAGLAIEDISLRVEPGETLAVVGPNGAGKSTLLKIMLGLLGGYAGRVEVCGRTPGAARREGLVGYVPQRSEAELWFPLSARRVVELAAARGAPAWRRAGAVTRGAVDRALDRVGALDLAERPVGSLSGGQWQRVLVARALSIEPRVLVLDEPTIGIDAAGQHRFGELLAALKRDAGLTILIVKHDLRAIASGAASCDRIACLRRTLHFHDTPKGITPEVLAEVFQHDLAPIFGDVHVDAHLASDCPGDHAHAGAPSRRPDGPGDG